MLLGAITKCGIRARHASVDIASISRPFVLTSSAGTTTWLSDANVVAPASSIEFKFHLLAHANQPRVTITAALASAPSAPIAAVSIAVTVPAAGDLAGVAKQLVYSRRLRRASELLSMQCEAFNCSLEAISLRANVNTVGSRTVFCIPLAASLGPAVVCSHYTYGAKLLGRFDDASADYSYLTEAAPASHAGLVAQLQAASDGARRDLARGMTEHAMGRYPEAFSFITAALQVLSASVLAYRSV
jgi:hypothetical protein